MVGERAAQGGEKQGEVLAFQDPAADDARQESLESFLVIVHRTEGRSVRGMGERENQRSVQEWFSSKDNRRESGCRKAPGTRCAVSSNGRLLSRKEVTCGNNMVLSGVRLASSFAAIPLLPRLPTGTRPGERKWSGEGKGSPGGDSTHLSQQPWPLHRVCNDSPSEER